MNHQTDWRAVALSEEVATGHAFSPRRISEILPGRVYALSGFEFTEYYFVVSDDRRELIVEDTREQRQIACIVVPRAKPIADRRLAFGEAV